MIIFLNGFYLFNDSITNKKLRVFGDKTKICPDIDKEINEEIKRKMKIIKMIS